MQPPFAPADAAAASTADILRRAVEDAPIRPEPDPEFLGKCIIRK